MIGMLSVRMISLVCLLSLSTPLSRAAPPSLDLNDVKSIESATLSALKNLLSYFQPNPTGVFEQVQTPWHESGMIWGMFTDHAKWSGDTQFMSLVSAALVNSSYGAEQDFLGGKMSRVAATMLGRWNDDILWPSLAAIGGAEVFGADSIMPGADGPWITLAQKTFDQADEQWDNQCGGGIYWSRDRSSASAPYKSLINQLEFIQQGARNFLQTKNQTALDRAKMAADWVFSSGLGNTQTGVLYDGMNVGECGKFTTHLWSYNYGSLLGALAWMHKATGNQTYMDLITPFMNYAAQTFSAQNVSGVVTETCEASKRCNRDQQGFKAIYVRNLAYVYRQTNNQAQKDSIRNTIDTSVRAMVQNSCDAEWNCGGNWTYDTAPVKYVRSQHVSAALLVTALGIHESNAAEGLLPRIQAGELSDMTNGAAGLSSGGVKNPGKVTSKPLGNHASGPVIQTSFFLFTIILALSLTFQ
uniref:Mannan endo-1,6-alpha-mannosidase n=1 Tax=Phakopsora pachyrhizi TaxID=170000 RepID=A0A0S1MJU0_PHAPC